MLSSVAVFIVFLMLCHTHSEKRKILKQLKEAKTALDEDVAKQREEWGQIAQKYSELEKKRTTDSARRTTSDFRRAHQRHTSTKLFGVI